MGMIFLVILIGSCGTNEKNTSPNKNETTVADEQGENKDISNGEYPMPILSGWEEDQITIETIGDGKIDVWHGEFSFEEEIDDYFELYQSALTDMGFDVTVTEDSEGMKSLDITKEIDGDEHVGNVLFTSNWVKSS